MGPSFPEIPIIPTAALKTMEGIFRQTAKTAELATIKGPAGVGKTMAIRHLAETMPGVDIHTATMRPEIAGNIASVAHAILPSYGGRRWMNSECMDVVWEMVRGTPFSPYATQTLLVIDEAQLLKPSVLDALRGLWDRGDYARVARSGTLPAFGMVLVGNPTFLDRTGGVRKAAYEPLTSRITYRVELTQPTDDELHAFVAGLPGCDETVREELVAFGMDTRNLRSITKAWCAARELDATIPLDCIKSITSFMGANA